MAQLDTAAKELEAELVEVSHATDKLRSSFEHYFQGIERLAPTTERDLLKRRVLGLHTTNIRNTELRFRINQLVAKFNSYNSYWTRVLRQIEEGSYYRDVYKAQYRSKKQIPDTEPIAEKQVQPSPAPTMPVANNTNKRHVINLNDESIHKIYNAYVTAKKRCKESTRGLTPETLGSSLRKQIPVIQKRFSCRSVEFKVVIKGGKAILKAVPKS